MPAGVDGKLATPLYPKPNSSVSVTIGGLPAQVLYAGGTRRGSRSNAG
jgi:uncharacterized protein (TIGR03437 family)